MRKVLALSLLVALIVIDGFLHLDSLIRVALSPVQMRFMVIRGWMDRISSCVISSCEVNFIPVKAGCVISSAGGYVLVKASAKEGDVLIDEAGNFVGKVIRSAGGESLVVTPLSYELEIQVTVVSSETEIEGRLLGGDPPLLSVPEGENVVGWDVYISRSERFGEALRAEGKGFIGRVIGKKGKMFIVRPVKPKERMEVLGE